MLEAQKQDVWGGLADLQSVTVNIFSLSLGFLLSYLGLFLNYSLVPSLSGIIFQTLNAYHRKLEMTHTSDSSIQFSFGVL